MLTDKHIICLKLNVIGLSLKNMHENKMTSRLRICFYFLHGKKY